MKNAVQIKPAGLKTDKFSRKIEKNIAKILQE